MCVISCEHSSLFGLLSLGLPEGTNSSAADLSAEPPDGATAADGEKSKMAASDDTNMTTSANESEATGKEQLDEPPAASSSLKERSLTASAIGKSRKLLTSSACFIC